MVTPFDQLVTSHEALDAIYPQPEGNALNKEIDCLNAPYRAMIEASPFCVIATAGPGGMDCSPRGDAPGFVRIHDDRTLLIPDRRGNNRIDSLRNIIEDPRVGLLFLIPGCGETLRINGWAAISGDPALLQGFAIDGKPPRSVTVVTIERVYYQCPKALVRSKLWDSSTWIDRASLPTSGKILAAITGGRHDAEKHDREYPARVKATLY